MANSKQDILNNIGNILDKTFERTETSKVPSLDDSYPTLNGNDWKFFHSAVLFIDLRGSTKFFNTHYDNVIAKIIMSYYKSIISVVHNHDWEIRSFNWDSLLVFFKWNTKEAINKAVKCAMQITYCINYILNPELEKKKYSKIDFWIWIDHWEILAIKVWKSKADNQDLVRIAEAVNFSAKMSDSASNPSHIFISKKVYINLSDETKYHVQKDQYWYETKTDMRSYKNLNISWNLTNTYSTTYYWKIN